MLWVGGAFFALSRCLLGLTVLKETALALLFVLYRYSRESGRLAPRYGVMPKDD